MFTTKDLAWISSSSSLEQLNERGNYKYGYIIRNQRGITKSEPRVVWGDSRNEAAQIYKASKAYKRFGLKFVMEVECV